MGVHMAVLFVTVQTEMGKEAVSSLGEWINIFWHLYQRKQIMAKLINTDGSNNLMSNEKSQ